MDRADYIRRVDAMALPESLRKRLGALPETRAGLEPAPTKGTGETRRVRDAAPYGGRGTREMRATTGRPYGRWATLAAALVLVVGLGVAAPAILHTLGTGGDITPPPVVTGVPAISDEELTELLAAEFPEAQEGDQWVLLYSLQQEGYTLGVLRYTSTSHASGLGNLIFGVFDHSSRALADDAVVIRGDHGQAYAWYQQDSVIGLLWTNYTEYQGWQTCSAGLYTFAHEKLTITTSLPKYRVSQNAVLPEGAETMFDPAKNGDFWENCKASINGGGLDVYRRNPEYTTESQETVKQWLLDFSIHFNFGDNSNADTIPDAELTELLAAEIPLEKNQQDTWKLVGSFGSTEGRTMGVLQYEWKGGSYMQADFSNLLLGVYDNATRELAGPVIRVNGHYTYAYHYTLPSGDGPLNYVLCINKNFGQGMAENHNAALYLYDGQELTQVTSSPYTDLPAGMEDMFDPKKNQAFWNEMGRKIILAPSGFEMFHRNGAYSIGGDNDNAYWVYDCYVPLGYKPPAPVVIETARKFFVSYYKDDPEGSSDYSIESCELVPDYGVAFYGEDSSAYRVVLEDYEGGLERYFVFDGNMELLNVATSEWASPWESYEGSLSQISIKGVPFGGLYNELDESIRATLEDTGETEDLSVTQPGWATPWILKTYRSASLEVVTATAPTELLEQLLEAGNLFRERYDRVLGTEYIYQVRPLDATYATEGGLRVGDSVAQAQKLFYNLSETGVKRYNSGIDYLFITTENGVVTDIVSETNTRTMGESVFY